MFESLDALQNQARTLLRMCGDYAAARGKPEAAKDLLNLAEKNERVLYEIAVIGFMKRGKSTLMNTLLGRPDTAIAPVDGAVCTAVITKYLDRSQHPEQKAAAVVCFLDGGPVEVSHEAAAQYISNTSNPDNIKGVKYIELYGDFPLIRSGVALVDTPGKGSVHNAHDVMVDEFLPMADAIVLTQSAVLPMEADERLFLSRLPDREKRRIFVVLTKFDKLDDDREREESVSFVRNQLRELGIPCGRIYCTAAKKVLDARKNRESEDVVAALAREWGITEMERALQEEIFKNSEKTAVLRSNLARIRAVLEEFLGRETDRLREGVESLEECDVDELVKRKEEIQEKRRSFLAEHERSAARFMRSWSTEIQRFLVSLDVIKARIMEKMGAEVEKKGLIALFASSSKLSRSMKDTVSLALAESVPALAATLEKLLSEYCSEMAGGLALPVEVRGKDLRSLGVIGGMGATGGAIAAGGSAAFSAASLLVPSSTATATAFSAAIVAGVQGVVLLGGVGLAVLAATKLATAAGKNAQLKEIARTLDDLFKDFTEQLESQLESFCKNALDGMSEQVQERLHVWEEQYDAIERAILRNDPSLKKRLEDELSVLNALNEEYMEFRNAYDAMEAVL